MHAMPTNSLSMFRHGESKHKLSRRSKLTTRWIRSIIHDSYMNLITQISCIMLLRLVQNADNGISTSLSLTPYLPLTYPSLTPHLPLTYPSLTPHLPLTYPSLTPHLPLTYPSLTPHLSLTYPSLTPHLTLTYPSLTFYDLCQ